MAAGGIWKPAQGSKLQGTWLYLLLRAGLVGGVVAALLGPASMLGLPDVWLVFADCMRCRVASAASAALAAAMLAASSNLSPASQQRSSEGRAGLSRWES